MWKRSLFISAAAIALAVVACTDTPTDPVTLDADLEPQFARRGPLVHSATGAGHIAHPSGVVLDDTRIFAFTALEHADGTVTGQAQLNIIGVGFGSENPAITNYFQAEVVCLTVEGDDAWIGAVIKTSSIPANIGNEVGWRVRDNGQGNSAEPDGISTTQFPTNDPGFAQAFCDAKPNRFLNVVEQGNIQVR